MTARHTPGRRAGFTLVELLVAIAIIVVLAAIAVAVVPSAMDQDRTTDAAATVRQHLMIAKARATRENNGRGVRFILAADPNNVVKGNNVLWATELQYIEAAPPLTPNKFGVTTADQNNGVAPAFLEFQYTPANTSNNTGAVAGKKCYLRNMPPGSEVVQVVQGDILANWFPRLYCPSLGLSTALSADVPAFTITNITQVSGADWELSLTDFPDSWVGAGASGSTPEPGATLRVYHFTIQPRSRPLLGEPNVPLPKNVCVDFAASIPGPRPSPLNASVPQDFEIMFAPNGQVIDPPGVGQILLWVRDYTKFSGNPAQNAGGVYNLAAFQQGGEQQIIAIKTKTGAMGVFPVAWPATSGDYLSTPWPDPYGPARAGVGQ